MYNTSFRVPFHISWHKIDFQRKKVFPIFNIRIKYWLKHYFLLQFKLKYRAW